MSFVLYGMMTAHQARTAGAAAGARSVAQSAISVADTAVRDLRTLEGRVDRLSLLTLALGEVLKRKTGMTDQEILKEVGLLDLLDGVPDGKIARTAQRCAGCERVISARHERCLFCGGEKLDPVEPGSLESMVR